MLSRTFLKVARSSRPICLRQFSEVLDIPTDKEQQWGRRKTEIDEAEKGISAFDHEHSLVPPADQGTKENPILVPSGAHSRTVGYEDPGTHQLVWFNLSENALHYVPGLSLYFKMQKLSNH